MSCVRLEVLPWAKSLFGSRSTGRVVLNEVITQGESVGDLLARLASDHPWFGEMVFDGAPSQVSGHVTVIVNGEMLELADALSTRLKDGDTLTLVHVLETEARV